MQTLPKFLSIILLLLFFIHFAFAQDEKGNCITDQIHQQKLLNDSIYFKNHQLQQEQTYQAIQKILAQRRKNPDLLNKTAALYNIPVVIHIIHNNGTENISDTQVQQAMQDLNDAFRHEAPYNGPKGVDIEIEFCLAKQDPNGNPTSGINRVVSTLTDHNSTNDLALKNLSRWDTKKYLNIWLVKEICMPSYGCSIAGYAYLAGAHGTNFDGIVNEARWFGSSKDASKIHTHEVGHYLNLFHTFDGGCPNNNCLLNGDYVCDTPPDDSKTNIACGSIVNSCTTDTVDITANNPFRPIALGGLGDQPDMQENYMDYSSKTCKNAFTQGQKDRMIYALTNIRSSLLSSVGCLLVCPVVVNANFNVSPALSVPLNTNVSFTNTSSNATTYEWFVNGISKKTTLNFDSTFTTAGTYQIRLIARNSAQSTDCIADTTIAINVDCPPFTAAFSSPNDTTRAGIPVSFTNTSTPTATFEWFVNGSSVATSTDYTFSSNIQGTYIIKLDATDGCTYSFIDTITVICPVQAFFETSATEIFTGGTVNFINTSLNATSYQWFVDDTLRSITTDYSQLFLTPGDFIVRLVATNDTCQDFIEQVVNVAEIGGCAIRNSNIWYFGDKAGLDFTYSAFPVAKFDSQMYAMEGCSSISNQFGDLLMYSNGYAVWNRNHTIMPNGSGLLGGFNSTQSVQIIPKPGSTSTYYIFTTDDEGGTDGLRYSEVEMSLNGGFGDVVSTAKNKLLHTPVAEKLTAVMHENNCDVWLIAHGWNNNQFLAYQITSLGIDTIPIVTNEGTSFGFAGGIQSQSVEAGQLKASPNGKKLAMAIRNASTSANGKADLFEIYDFNAGTGVVTNAQTLASSNGAIGSGSFFLPYGVEFSPDNSKVFVSNEYNYIFQFDLDADSLSAIINSKTNIIISSPIGQENNYYALQLAADAKIYVATGTKKLGVIQKPNALGTAVEYNAYGGFPLDSADCVGNTNPDSQLCRIKSNKGLPPFIPNNFNQLDFIYGCNRLTPTGMVFDLRTKQTNIDNIIWDFGDTLSGINNFSNRTTPFHSYSAYGYYLVTLTAKKGCLCSQIVKEVYVSPICDTELASNHYNFEAQSTNQFIELAWQVNNPTLWESYNVEKSVDGLSFEPIATVNAFALQNEFKLMDAWQNHSLLYYRLQLIEKTGNHFYSLIQKVEKNAQDIKVYPVPVLKGEDLHLEFTQKEENSKIQIQLTDVLGRVIYQQNKIMIEDNPMTIPTQNLAVGLYHVIIQTATRRRAWKVWVH